MSNINDPKSQILRSTFSSQGMSFSDAFAIWKESVSPLFIPSIKGEKEDFVAKLDAVNLYDLVFASGHITCQEFHRNQDLCRKDQVDHILLQIYLTGGYIGNNGKNKVFVQSNDISLLDLGHEVNTQAQRSQNLSVVIPRDLWQAQSKKNASHYGLTLQGKSTMGYILGQHIKSMWTASLQAQQSEAKMMSESLLSVASHCLNAVFESDNESDIFMGQATLTAIQRYIQANLHDSLLCPEKICHVFNCSRSYLYRLFQSLNGVASYIQKQRLEKCYQELISLQNKTRSISEIAFSWGFNNQSHFSRLFRKTFGISPKQARELGVAIKNDEGILVEDAKNENEIPDYRKWFLNL